MNQRTKAQLAAQARQMAFELGYLPTPDAAEPEERGAYLRPDEWTEMKNEYARREADQERAAYEAEARYEAVYADGSPVPTAPRRYTPNAVITDPATEKQLAFLKRLTAERDVTEPNLAAKLHACRNLAMRGALRKGQASKLIELLLAAPKLGDARPGSPAGQEPPDGIYIDPETDTRPAQIYKVYAMVHGSGRQGVKHLRVRQLEDIQGWSGEFVYLGLAVKHLPKTARLMSLAEAKEYGSIYGFCVRCGATLTDEESIAAGIGPVCAGKFTEIN